VSTAVASTRSLRAPQALPRLLTGIQPSRALTLAEHVAELGPLELPHDLIATLDASGLRGRGGAAFPTAVKFQAVASQRGRPIVVANAAEGEPASSKDRALARLTPHLILDGVVASAAALRARRAVVAVSETAKRERKALEHAVSERRERLEIEIATVPESFVSGEETALLRALGGGPAKPTLKPPYPFERGLDGAPTLVQNAETLAHIGLIARFGADWFRASPTALVTLGGAVNRPGVHEVQLGLTLGDLILRLGGTSAGVSGFLVGGYFGRWIPARSGASLQLTPETIGAGAILAFPESTCAVAECARVVRYLAGESAGQCGPCVNGLDAIAGALEEHSRGADRLPQLRRWSEMVTGRGACRHPDGAARFVESALAVFADEFEQHARHGNCGKRIQEVLPL
jgi:NADH:ubiquinone oxidoreductase subunit F (NADH-binding)